ncbi:MAG: hypothetical protein A4E28_00172 [Methanocella sp. PtaU1.Bin125]|nr:MAG: hypothetical protein A4E28_00172 [Methanocella sp. PtaU1.Bin125]
MPTIEDLIRDEKVSRISEFEKPRYPNFYDLTFRDDLRVCELLASEHPRWSIISGYYAMHEATKLFLAKNFGYKVLDKDVHSTTINLLSIVLRESHEDIVELFESGYGEYKALVGELYGAREERRKAQYYTGTDFTRALFFKKAQQFHDQKVVPYIEKISLLGDAL